MSPTSKSTESVVDYTADGRYIVVDGRKWRASDPSLDRDERGALVAELMSARRAVGEALRRNDPEAERAARNRVNDAKVALGERGTPWWEAGPDVEPRKSATKRATQRAEARRQAASGLKGEEPG